MERKRVLVLLSIVLSGIIIILFITTMILGILFGIERSKTKRYQNVLIKDNEINDLCLTPFCIQTANSLVESLDESIDPCENFYEFTCGKWMKNTKIRDDANSHDRFKIMQNKLDDQIIELLSSSTSNKTQESNSIMNARRLYSSCLDEDQIERDGIDSIISLINEQFGGWPILNGSKWNQSSFHFYRLLIKLSQLNSLSLFSIYTYVDEKNSSAYSIYLGQGSVALRDRAYYLNESNVTSTYRQLIKGFSLLLTNDTSMIDEDIKQIFSFEKRIAEIFWTRAQRYLSFRTRTVVANLSSIMNTTFRFDEYIRQFYLLANVSLLDHDIIIISEFEVLQNISMLIQRESPRTLQNYLVWRFLMNIIEYMPKRFRQLKQEFNRVFRGIKSEKERQTKCGNYVNEYMGLAVSKLYIDKYFDPDSRKESIEMIKNIRNIFTEMVNESKWMDLQSKSAAIEKINSISERVGYPDGLDHNITNLERTYQHYHLNGSYFRNILLINRLEIQENLQKLRETVIDRKAWSSILPTDINAYYRRSFNDITFTAAILQSPFFNKNAPKYLNYGGIGMVIGHELTHGFDSIGRQFDKNGNRIPWWTNETIKAFDKQKMCIINQYNNYTLTQFHLNVNGQQTQGEDIADNGGLKQTFFAYRKWAQINGNTEKRLPGLSKYSPEQMLFINYGHSWCSKTRNEYATNAILTDLHSPPEFRVIGPTSNFVEFDRTFGCRPGQGNSRINKCTVW